MKNDAKMKRIVANMKAVREAHEHEGETHEEETVVFIDKYYMVGFRKFHARKLGNREWQIEAIDDFPYIEFKMEDLVK